MGNHTVKNEKSSPAKLTEKEEKKIPAGLDDKTTFLVCTGIKAKNVKEIGEKAKKETIMAFDLEAKGKLQRAVVPEEYVVIKAYNNKSINKDKKKQENDEKDKDKEEDTK